MWIVVFSRGSRNFVLYCPQNYVWLPFEFISFSTRRVIGFGQNEPLALTEYVDERPIIGDNVWESVRVYESVEDHWIVTTSFELSWNLAMLRGYWEESLARMEISPAYRCSEENPSIICRAFPNGELLICRHAQGPDLSTGPHHLPNCMFLDNHDDDQKNPLKFAHLCNSPLFTDVLTYNVTNLQKMYYVDGRRRYHLRALEPIPVVSRNPENPRCNRYRSGPYGARVSDQIEANIDMYDPCQSPNFHIPSNGTAICVRRLEETDIHVDNPENLPITETEQNLLQRSVFIDYIIAPSMVRTAGNGMFTMQALENGDLIGFYIGVEWTITPQMDDPGYEDWDEVVNLTDLQEDEENYALMSQFPSKVGNGSIVTSNLTNMKRKRGRRTINFPDIGNATKYMNGSRVNPNCAIATSNMLYAIRAIPLGEELVWDYGDTYFLESASTWVGVGSAWPTRENSSSAYDSRPDLNVDQWEASQELTVAYSESKESSVTIPYGSGGASSVSTRTESIHEEPLPMSSETLPYGSGGASSVSTRTESIHEQLLPMSSSYAADELDITHPYNFETISEFNAVHDMRIREPLPIATRPPMAEIDSVEDLEGRIRMWYDNENRERRRMGLPERRVHYTDSDDDVKEEFPHEEAPPPAHHRRLRRLPPSSRQRGLPKGRNPLYNSLLAPGGWGHKIRKYGKYAK